MKPVVGLSIGTVGVVSQRSVPLGFLQQLANHQSMPNAGVHEEGSDPVEATSLVKADSMGLSSQGHP